MKQYLQLYRKTIVVIVLPVVLLFDNQNSGTLMGTETQIPVGQSKHNK